MEANYYIGVDVSKERLDWQANDFQNQQRGIGKAANTPNGIHSLLRSWAQKGLPTQEVIVCFEHTGPYGLLLAAMLEQADVRYVVVAAAQVQRSLGIRRGTSDPIDAGRLAEYGWRFRDRLQPSQLPSEALLQLRGWLLWREKLVKMRTALANGIKANELTARIADLGEITRQMEGQQAALTEQIRHVDRTIRRLLQAYNSTEGQYELLVSIPGIGPVIAGWLLVYTQGFTRFDNARQLACFAGSAPFPNQSGQHKNPDRGQRVALCPAEDIAIEWRTFGHPV